MTEGPLDESVNQKAQPYDTSFKEKLSMYDQLWEESPTIQKMRQEYLQKGVQKGLERGRQEGEIQALQRSLINIAQAKYPELTGVAQQQVQHFNNSGALYLLIQKMATAPNVDVARWLLQLGA